MDAVITRSMWKVARGLLIGTAGAAGAVLAASSAASAATTATFTHGVLTVFGDSGANTITIGRNAAGAILVNNGAIPVTGGTPTVANTTVIQVFGQAGNDHLALDETNGALPRANLFAGGGNDILTGGSGADLLFGQAGNDTLLGRGGSDILFGGGDADQLVGGDADDQAFGEAGDDTMVWNPGDDTDLNEGGAGNDQVVVNGGNGAEQFTTTANGARVRFDRVTPAPFSIDIGTSEKLVLNANGGDDQFSATGNLAALIALTVDGGTGNDTILGGNGVDTLFGGDGDDLVDGNQGNDVAFLGAGSDTFQWDPGDGSDIVEGQDGTDTMRFNGSNVSERFQASANGGRLRFTRDVANIVMDTHGVEIVDVAALGGSDSLTVGDLAGTGVVELDADLASAPGGNTGDGQADTVTVVGRNGADVIDISGGGTSASVAGLAASVNITGAEGANDRLVVQAAGGNDTVTATTLPADVIQLTLDGGAGNDAVRGSQGADTMLGGDGNDSAFGDNGNDVALLGAGDDAFQWDPGDGSDTVEGQDGRDALRFNGANVSENIDIAANGGRVRLSRDVANVTMDLDDVESVQFRALGGADNVVVNDLSGTDVTAIDADLAGVSGGGDGSADTVTVNGTQGADTFGPVGDAGGIDVRGLHTAVHIDAPEAGNDRLVLNALGGDDVVNASSLRAGGIQLTENGGIGADQLLGSAGGDLVNGGDGNDVALMGAGDDAFAWNPGDDNDTLEGQAGRDTMVFNGANVSENIDIAANGGRVRFFRNVANVTMDLNDVEDIAFAALGGSDTIVVNDLSGTDVDQVDLAMSNDGAADNVIVDATNGDDVVLVNGDAGATSVVGLPARVNITATEAANDRLTVNALAGDDVVEASGLQAGAIQLTADGGQGNDVIIGGAGNDTLLGGPGDDVLLGGGGTDVIDGGDGDDIEIQLAPAGPTQLVASGDRVSSATPADAEWVLGHVRIVGGATVIDLAGKQYRLSGTDLSQLVAAATDMVATSEPTASSEPETSEPATSAPIGDLVWLDTNGDGLQDAGEPGIAGIVVRLLDSSGARLDEVTTDAGGHYELTPSTAGPFTLEVVLPDGYRPTVVDVGADEAVDSDADPGQVVPGRTETTVRIATADVGATVDSDLDVGLVAVIDAPAPTTTVPTATVPPTTTPTTTTTVVTTTTTVVPTTTTVVPTTTTSPTTTTEAPTTTVAATAPPTTAEG